MKKSEKNIESLAGLYERRDIIRSNLLKYTRQAFHSLPPQDSPRVLDIGCGSGIVTLELARMSRGKITAIDVDQEQLDRLASASMRASLSGSIEIINRSMFNLDFPDEHFDIIWAEGSISFIGFAEGLKEWYKFLRTGGYLVIHDDLDNLEEKHQKIKLCGYELLNQIILDSKTWWTGYYKHMEQLIGQFPQGQPADSTLQATVAEELRQLDGFRQNPDRYQSVFFVLKKL